MGSGVRLEETERLGEGDGKLTVPSTPEGIGAGRGAGKKLINQIVGVESVTTALDTSRYTGS